MARRGANAVHNLARRAALWRRGIFPEVLERRLALFERLDPRAQELQSLALLRRLVAHAASRVPYYTRISAEQGLRPEDLREQRDFRRFPVLTKERILEAGDELIDPVLGRHATWNATGGSTGVPLRFLRSDRARGVMAANEARLWRWYGAPRGARQALLWGADRDLSPTQSVGDWKNRLLGVCQLNAFLVDEERCRTFAGILVEFQPEIIYGYATALARFAAFLRDSGIDLEIRPRAIRSTAEVLLAEQRALIEAQLHGPVFDFLGGREMGPVAGECIAREGLHVFPDVSHVEILRTDGAPCEPGESGELVVTKLHEYAMPFLRYRTGDRAAWLAGRCRCGLGFPRLSSVEGRVGDFVRAPDGRQIHGEFFTHLFYGSRGIARFQVRQTSPGTLRILVQPSDHAPPEPERLEAIRREAAEHFGAALADVTLDIVDQIEPGPSGKHRFVLPYDPSR